MSNEEYKKHLIKMCGTIDAEMSKLKHLNGTTWWYVTGQQMASNFEEYAEFGDNDSNFDPNDWHTAWIGFEFWDRHLLDAVDRKLNEAESAYEEWLAERVYELFCNDADATDAWYDIHFVSEVVDGEAEHNYENGFTEIMKRMHILDADIDRYIAEHGDYTK